MPAYKADPFGDANTATLSLPGGVDVYGGFSGNELAPSERNLALHATIVSGEIGTPAASDNLRRVVTSSGTTKLDGLTVTAGYSIGAAAGIDCLSGSLELNRVTATANRANRGAGLHVGLSCSARVTFSEFSGNAAYEVAIAASGGAINNEGALVVEDSKFVGNTANAEAQGGAIWTSSAITVKRCIFEDNAAIYAATGLSGSEGGAIYSSSFEPIQVDGCTFLDNKAWGTSYNIGRGGAIMATSAALTNNVFVGNSAYGSPLGSGGAVQTYTSAVIEDCRFETNASGEGGGVYVMLGTAKLKRSQFLENNASNGGALYAAAASKLTLVSTSFESNQATSPYANEGGGAIWFAGASLDMANVSFAFNTSMSTGGAIRFTDDNSTLTGRQCTFFGNQASRTGGAMHNRRGLASFWNSIFWGNTATTDGNQIFDETAAAQVTLSHCDVQGSGLNGADGNIDADPDFVNTSLQTLDLSLATGSPCIDSGDTTSLPVDTLDVDSDGNTSEQLPFDLAGRPREAKDNVDMGALETQP